MFQQLGAACSGPGSRLWCSRWGCLLAEEKLQPDISQLFRVLVGVGSRQDFCCGTFDENLGRLKVATIAGSMEWCLLQKLRSKWNPM